MFLPLLNPTYKQHIIEAFCNEKLGIIYYMANDTIRRP